MKVPACCLWDFAARCLILEVMLRSCVLSHVSLQVSSICSVCFFPPEFWNQKRLFLQAFRNSSSRISKLNFARRLLSTLSETSLFTQSTISLQLAFNAHFYNFAWISYTMCFLYHCQGSSLTDSCTWCGYLLGTHLLKYFFMNARDWFCKRKRS